MSNIKEVNPCACSHGRDRHSENVVEVTKKKSGIICLLPDCKCVHYIAVKE